MRSPKRAFASIVCAVDFSSHSAMALRYAAALAKRTRAHLVAVTAIDPFLSAAAAAAYDVDTLKSTATLELRRFVAKVLPRGEALTRECQVVVDKPVRAILAAVERAGAHLLVIGTHGLSGVRKAFFGSTGAALLRKCTLPVLAVPPRSRRPRPEWPQAGVIGALPFGEHAARDAALMSQTASFLGVPLDVVVTVPNVRAPLWLRVSRRALNRHHAGLAQSWLDRRLAAGSARGTHVLVGDKAEDIAAFAADRGADLLMIETPLPRAGIPLAAADIAYRLLCVAPCPVLVLPHPPQGARTGRRRRLRAAA